MVPLFHHGSDSAQSEHGSDRVITPNSLNNLSPVHIKKFAKLQRAPSEQDQQQQHDPDPVFYREVDLSDLPSEYAEEVETFRHILDLPDPRETMPRPSATVVMLDDVNGQQELRPRDPSGMLPLNPYLKDAFEKFEQEFQASNLSKGKYIKPAASTAKWYKVGQPCFEDKLQELKTDFGISPKPYGQGSPRQNLCTINFAATFAKTASVCNTTMEKCQDNLSLLSKRLKARFKRVPILKKQPGMAMETTLRF